MTAGDGDGVGAPLPALPPSDAPTTAGDGVCDGVPADGDGEPEIAGVPSDGVGEGVVPLGLGVLGVGLGVVGVGVGVDRCVAEIVGLGEVLVGVGVRDATTGDGMPDGM